MTDPATRETADYPRILLDQLVAEVQWRQQGELISVQVPSARFANAVAYLDCAPADVTWRAGVDALSFGFLFDLDVLAQIGKV